MMTKKLIFAFLVIILTFTTARADTPSLRQLFIEMPDSIIPYLSHNNRLDLLDFMDSNMKSEVTNDFGGKSVMTVLTEDSISVQLNELNKAKILLLESTLPVDSSNCVIALIRTIYIDNEQMETDLKYYSVKWRRLTEEPKLSPAHKELMKRYAKPSNIINFLIRRVIIKILSLFGLLSVYLQSVFHGIRLLRLIEISCRETIDF